jgi:DNA-binding MarR family transcriptional regulator
MQQRWVAPGERAAPESGLRRPRPFDKPCSVARPEPDEFLERFSDLSRCLRALAGRTYATFEVGSTQAKFLRHIGQNSRISQADLARATATDPTLTGRALETLIDRGWVRRSNSAADRRQYVLQLTAAGQRIRKKVEEARRRIAVQMTDVLDARDLEDFERIARKLLAALDEPAEA